MESEESAIRFEASGLPEADTRVKRFWKSSANPKTFLSKKSPGPFAVKLPPEVTYSQASGSQSPSRSVSSMYTVTSGARATSGPTVTGTGAKMFLPEVTSRRLA